MNYEKITQDSMAKCVEMTHFLEEAVVRTTAKYAPVIESVSGGMLTLIATQGQGVDAQGNDMHVITLMLADKRIGQGTPVGAFRSSKWPSPGAVEKYFSELIEIQLASPTSTLIMALTTVMRNIREAQKPQIVVPKK